MITATLPVPDLSRDALSRGIRGENARLFAALLELHHRTSLLGGKTALPPGGGGSPGADRPGLLPGATAGTFPRKETLCEPCLPPWVGWAVMCADWALCVLCLQNSLNCIHLIL
jgi:hypothetical protein